MRTITEKDIHDSIVNMVESVKSDYDDDIDISDRVSEVVDREWGSLVQWGMTSEYTVDDLVNTAQPCVLIIKYAKEHAWVEGDPGLWKGLTYGILASVALFSFQNCLRQALRDSGINC